MAILANSRLFRTISFILIIRLCPFAYGKVIHVDNDGQADFDTIQAGIDAAMDGDTVLVSPGEYIITEPITFQGKAIIVKSEVGPDETTIRMGTPDNLERGSVVIFENSETTASVLDGFTLTGGKGSLVEEKWGGGGILFINASSATVINCAIVQNCAESGGGVVCNDDSSLAMTNCNFRDNVATGNTWFVNGYGGALLCRENSSMTINNCTFGENSAGVGGGVLFNYESSVTMTDCVMTGNTAHGWGGAIQCIHASSVLTNCVIARNSAGINHGGLLVEQPFEDIPKDSSMVITNCSIWGNSAGEKESGISCVTGASATIKNSIIRENTAAGGSEIRIELDPSILSIAHSNIAGGQSGVTVKGGTLNWGMGNIDDDPCFVDPSLDDFHLKSQAGRWNPNSQSWVQDDATSHCIDTGDPNSPIGNEPFPNGGIINMGAYGGTAEASKSLSEKNIYIFWPQQSMVFQAGGIAGVNRAYILTGQFQLTIDFGAGKARFSNVEAIATRPSEPVRKLDPNDVFNLTGLTGTIRKDGSIKFTGRTADESNVLLYLTLSDELISLKGQTTPPPNSADFFIFDLDAIAQRKYGGGTGELNYPYLIYTAEQLNAISAEPNDYDKHFKLMADIDLSGYSYDAAIIAPDVDPCDLDFQGASFKGIFDGNGHKISNLTIAGVHYLGLFGRLEYGAEIKNLSVIDVNIAGTDYVAGIVGFSKGNISISYCTGMVSGNRFVGGLTGRNWSAINASCNAATVTGHNDVGGLAAGNYGSITNSYNTGAITTNWHAGGLAGTNNGSISASYSTGVISSTTRAGGLVGYNNWDYGVITSSFWDTETSGQSTSDGGTGKTTAEMQTASTFLEAGWDFTDETANGTEDIWWIDESRDYPKLWWENRD